MPDPSALISKVLPLCEPTHSQERRIARAAQEAKAHVDSYVAQLDEVVDVVFGGSFAKGTWLPDHADIDIFVKIKRSVGAEKFEEMGRQIGSKALKMYGPKLRYSDHPYVEVFVKNVRVNVVPCYDVEQGKWQSAADRSPFHTQYISSHFDNEKRRHARLLKKFFQSVGIYGAEISTEGFSGYVSEVLVLKYSSFENVLRSAADWQERQIIAVCDYDSDFVKAFNSPLIIIDPVDSRRNLGTAISQESVAKFMLAARTFLEKPSIEFFRESNKKYRCNGPSKKLLLPNVLVVEFSHEKKSPDIIWGQLKRSINAIAKQLELAHFEVLRISCITNERNSAALAFLLESITLPAYTKKKGPEIFRRKDTASFLSNRKRTRPIAIWVDREMRISMVIERRFTDARKFVKSLLLNHRENSGISKDLIVNKLQIYSGSDRKITRGLAKEAIGDVISTERLIFK
ncbi:MAG: CCA tRNA nucleotidyltransferase [Thermoproteota archaeon]|jgi:tRNA nucleotidyltransferase (CCA-adding enzyme)|nr:CCA tRNA nucleotidyltransferase [Thermoproteota archaeon]